MRVLRHACVTVAATVLAAGLAACGSDGTTGTKAAGDAVAGAAAGLDPRAALAASAVVMQRAGNGSLALTAEAGPMAGTAEWQQRTVVDVAAKTESGTRARIIGDEVYLGGGLQTTAVLGGKHWARIEPKDPVVGSMSVMFLTVAQLTNPVLQLSAAAQGGKLTKVGAEAVGGVQTTHYRAVEEVAKLADTLSALGGDQRAAVRQTLDTGGSTLTVDFWINDKQELVQLREYGDKGGESSAVTVTYSGLGAAPKIEAPAAGDVGKGADFAKLFRS
ncbi:hypothetical protein ACFWA9_01930 [Kitasatospora sp. NPDC059973]|uniref:hypothetical protein n=1 Tax=Kitasatospora sp. NPDC059973 TaxID=3347020 RepID=UPI00369EF338